MGSDLVLSATMGLENVSSLESISFLMEREVQKVTRPCCLLASIIPGPYLVIRDCFDPPSSLIAWCNLYKQARCQLQIDSGPQFSVYLALSLNILASVWAITNSYLVILIILRCQKTPSINIFLQWWFPCNLKQLIISRSCVRSWLFLSLWLF